MRKTILPVMTVAVICGTLTTCTVPAPPTSFQAASPFVTAASFRDGAEDGTNDVVAEYCTRCHSERMRRGDLVLEGFDVANAPQNGEIVEKMIRKLRAGMMPPSGARRPDPVVIAEVARDLESILDKAAERNPNPGTRTFQRLNRAEYHNTIRELFGIEVDVSTFLPLDTKSANQYC